MKEVAIDLRAAYRLALKDNVTYNGVTVPVFGKVVPPDAQFPYIWFNGIETAGVPTKMCFENDTEINVEIVHKTSDGSEEWVSDEISNQVKIILAQLNQVDYPTWGTNFHFVEVTFQRDQELTHFVEDGWVFRKILTFRNLIDEA